MPNWCMNEITIKGDEATIKEIATIIEANPDGLFQMNDFVPMPEELRDTTAPQDSPNWYDWSISNWGTKWDLSENTQHTIDSNAISISFDTAWSPNCEFWATFSEKYPTLTIEHRYYEDGMSFIGEAYYEAGNTDDYCQDLTPEMYVKAGAVLDEDGEVDWDNSDIDLFTLFPLSELELVNG